MSLEFFGLRSLLCGSLWLEWFEVLICSSEVFELNRDPLEDP